MAAIKLTFTIISQQGKIDLVLRLISMAGSCVHSFDTAAFKVQQCTVQDEQCHLNCSFSY